VSPLALDVRLHAARTRRASACLLGVLILVALFSAVRPSAADAAPPAAGYFGVNPGDLFKLPERQWDAHLQTMKQHGVEVVRLGAWWSDLEPGPPVDGVHRYSWSELDPKVAALARNGLRWEPLISFSATWGSTVEGDYNAPPKGTENMAAFAGALAKRYGPGGEFWAANPQLPQLPVEAYELWNEQNAALYWSPASSAPEKYAELYQAVRNAVHAAQPAARVVVGGLAATVDGVLPADDFMRRMLAHRPGLRGNIDAVGLHPYARDPEGVLENVAKFRARLDAIAGPGIPIEITEIGWTTVDVSESRRAANLGEVTSKLSRSDCGVERLMAYSWVGPELDSGDREQWFGIVRKDGTPRPSASAFADAIRSARASGDTVSVCGGAAAEQARESGVAPARSARAGLKLRVRKARRGRRLLLFARCRTECRLNVKVRGARRARSARASRVSRGTARRHRMSVKVPLRLERRGGRVRVRVTAVGVDGTRVTRVRRVRVR